MTAPRDLAAAARDAIVALAATATDPADAIRLLLSLLNNATPANAVANSSEIGLAITAMQGACNDLYRRSIAIALGKAAAKYQPASIEDAAEVRALICGALDDEITIAGNQGEDKTFNALRGLRTAVSDDLTKRAAGLPGVSTIETALPVPALVLAQRSYRDAARNGELVAQSNCVHPAFMPTSFKALNQ